MNRWIAIGEIEFAINRARQDQPASGPEASLAREVSALAGLYGRLIWERQEGVAGEALTDAERTALLRWLPPTSGAGG